MDFVTVIGLLASIITIVGYFRSAKVSVFVPAETSYDTVSHFIRPLHIDFPAQGKDGQLLAVCLLGGKVCHYSLGSSDDDVFLTQAVPSGDFHRFLQCESMRIRSSRSSSFTLFVKVNKSRILSSCSIIFLFTSVATFPSIKWVSIK